MTSVGMAWRAARASRPARQRASMVMALVAWMARVLPAWPRVRTAVMQVGGFIAIDYGVWSASHIWGYVAAGVSLLVLEALSGSSGSSGGSR
jgi:hypothetical protein